MHEFFKYIPGFRSNKTWRKIIAIIYYAFSLIMFFVDWASGLFWFSGPFVVFSFIDLVQHKNKDFSLQKTLIPFLLSFSLMITGLAAEGPIAADQKQAELAKKTELEEQQQAEADKKEAEEKAALEAAQKAEEEEQHKKEEEEAARKAEEESKKAEEEKKKQEEEAAKANAKVEGQLKVHYIDVGQGDCELIQTGNASMLIDAGNSGNGPGIVSYIKGQGINRLNYLILTHPHADHIGGAADVINAFDIDQIIMPKVSHTSKTFENLLLTIKSKGLKVTSPTPGTDYELGSAKFTILGPDSASYSNLNNYSVVNKVTFGNTSFLFMGDAELESENEILSQGYDIKADVLKVGHHGSDTSTTSSFLSAVNPKYAVISVGHGNKYGHPNQSVLNSLSASKVEVYRTDESGTVIATSDGETITFDKKASPIKANAPPKSTTVKSNSNKSSSKGQAAVVPAPSKNKVKPKSKTDGGGKTTVYITDTGKKYHRDGCQYLKKSKIPISLEKAKKSYSPCSKCHPPQ